MLKRFLLVSIVLFALNARLVLADSVPLVFICTDGGNQITKEHDVGGWVHVSKQSLDDGPVDINACPGKFDAKTWDRMQLKVRGSTSAHFAKKQYRLQFIDNKGKDEDKSLLGLPAASDWVLYAPYIDRSQMRNLLAYRIGRQIGADRNRPFAGPRTKVMELVINNAYMGLFILVEKIDRNPERIPIAKADMKAESGSAFIAQVKSFDGDFEVKVGTKRTKYEFVYPSSSKVEKFAQEDSDAAQNFVQSVKDSIERFERALVHKQFSGPDAYDRWLDFDSAVDFFIVEEVFKNIDGFRRSVYLYKDSGPDQKVFLGPYWDFNAAMGNLSFYGMASSSNWINERHNVILRDVPWFQALLHDERFVQAVKERYADLRADNRPLHDDAIIAMIRTATKEMGGAPERDKKVWDGTFTFAQRHWMNTREHSKTFAGNVEILRHWMIKRMAWLDKHFKEL